MYSREGINWAKPLGAYSSYNISLGRGGVLGQGKGSGSWVKKWLMGILAVTGYESV